MKNIQKMMKQVQKMQAEMARTQELLAEQTVEATAGGGVVTVVVNGHQEVKSIKIDASVVDSEDVEMLEDLVLAAVNEGLRKSKDMAQEAMAKVTSGLDLPDMPGLPGF